MKVLIKLRRYMNPRPILCVYCLREGSLGQTTWGRLGCRSCQKPVDDYIKANFLLVEEK